MGLGGGGCKVLFLSLTNLRRLVLPKTKGIRLKLLAYLHGYPGPGGHNAGAERYASTVLEDLAARGHECHVAIVGTRAPVLEEQRGVKVHFRADRPQIQELFEWADAIITHLDLTRSAIWEIEQLANRKPLVHLVHNDKQLEFHQVTPETCALAVFNSNWLRQAVQWQGAQMVLHPRIRKQDYLTSRGDAVTLINLSEAKGGQIFFELARRMPERRFLGVRGAYADQEIPYEIPPNVELMDTVDDARKIYEQTRTLLVPSSYESYGRVGIEAMVSGIPVIAHPTPGLRESLGNAGIFCDRLEIEKWKHTIEQLDDAAFYEKVSNRSVKRAKTVSIDKGLDELETRLLAIAAIGRRLVAN